MQRTVASTLPETPEPSYRIRLLEFAVWGEMEVADWTEKTASARLGERLEQALGRLYRRLEPIKERIHFVFKTPIVAVAWDEASVLRADTMDAFYACYASWPSVPEALWRMHQNYDEALDEALQRWAATCPRGER